MSTLELRPASIVSKYFQLSLLQQDALYVFSLKTNNGAWRKALLYATSVQTGVVFPFLTRSSSGSDLGIIDIMLREINIYELPYAYGKIRLLAPGSRTKEHVLKAWNRCECPIPTAETDVDRILRILLQLDVKPRSPWSFSELRSSLELIVDPTSLGDMSAPVTDATHYFKY